MKKSLVWLDCILINSLGIEASAALGSMAAQLKYGAIPITLRQMEGSDMISVIDSSGLTLSSKPAAKTSIHCASVRWIMKNEGMKKNKQEIIVFVQPGNPIVSPVVSIMVE